MGSAQFNPGNCRLNPAYFTKEVMVSLRKLRYLNDNKGNKDRLAPVKNRYLFLFCILSFSIRIAMKYVVAVIPRRTNAYIGFHCIYKR